MISVIIDGGTRDSRAHYLTQLIPPQANLIQVTAETTSIGISQIKSLLTDLSLTSATARIVWIEEAQALTPDASGALLKILEEPPNNTTIYLTCESAASLLATIRSRCQIITLKQSIETTSQSTTHLSTLKTLFSLSAGDRLTHTSDFPSDRSELLAYLQELSLEIHHVIATTKSASSLKILHLLASLTLQTHAALKSNSSPSLTLAHFLLHLPKLK